MRKDEMNKYAMLNEQLRAAQAENQVSFRNREIHIYLQKNRNFFPLQHKSKKCIVTCPGGGVSSDNHPNDTDET